jgi:hypothetical protein
MADIVCANEDQIRRRWSNTAMNGAYLTSLPKEMLRSMGMLPHPRADPFILLVPPTYQSLQEVVPGDRRMA